MAYTKSEVEQAGYELTGDLTAPQNKTFRHTVSGVLGSGICITSRYFWTILLTADFYSRALRKPDIKTPIHCAE